MTFASRSRPSAIATLLVAAATPLGLIASGLWSWGSDATLRAAVAWLAGGLLLGIVARDLADIARTLPRLGMASADQTTLVPYLQADAPGQRLNALLATARTDPAAFWRGFPQSALRATVATVAAIWLTIQLSSETRLAWAAVCAYLALALVGCARKEPRWPLVMGAQAAVAWIVGQGALRPLGAIDLLPILLYSGAVATFAASAGRARGWTSASLLGIGVALVITQQPALGALACVAALAGWAARAPANARAMRLTQTLGLLMSALGLALAMPHWG